MNSPKLASRVARRSLMLAGSLGICGLAFRNIASAAEAPAPQAVPGKSAPPFEVIDSTRRKRSLAEFKGKLVVLEWTSPSCPFAKAQYDSGKMQELQKWAAQKGVVWLTVLSSHPSRSDYLDPDNADAFNRGRGGLPTALLIDADGKMGHRYGAMTADHMFVIDRAGKLAYAGGIDDSDSMDPKEVATANNFVRAALVDMLAGRPVKMATSEPVGCALSYAG